MKIIFTAMLLCIFTTCLAQESYNVYHGNTGRSAFIEKGKPNGKKIEVIAPKGRVLTIFIQNAHPALYEYSFKSTTIKEEENTISGSSGLVSLLNSLIAVPSGGVPPARIVAAGTVSWQDDYRNKINEVIKQLNEAQIIINKSDAPGTISQAENSDDNVGFLYAQKELMVSIPLFNDKDIENTFKKWAAQYKTSPYSYDPNDATEETLMAAFDSYLMAQLKLFKQLQSNYNSKVPSTSSHTVIVGDSIQVVSLSVKNKSTDLISREVGEDIIQLIIKPEYQHATLEFVPVLTIGYSKDAKKFAVTNGVITQQIDDGVKFNAGGVLNYNFLPFGERRNWALGAGLGFAISNKQFDNLFANLMISFQKWARIGVGYGWLNTPTYLKEGAQINSPLPANVTDLSKIVGYEKRPSFMITVVIPGLTLPVLK